MDTEGSHKIYILRYDSNSDTDCFLSIVIHGQIPNDDHSYRGSEFDYKYISGDADIYRRSVESAKGFIWNGYCTATQIFFFNTFYEVTKSEPAFFYSDSETRKKSKDMKPVYEVKCRDIYFKKRTTLKMKYDIMKEILDRKIAADQLRDEILKPI